MKTLYLPLKAKWYEMIESGEKKEEYREIKPYYICRIARWKEGNYDPRRNGQISSTAAITAYNNGDANKIGTDVSFFRMKDFDAVRFSYGYTKRTMTFEIESIRIGKGRPEWGAPEEDVFIIKLGNMI